MVQTPLKFFTQVHPGDPGFIEAQWQTLVGESSKGSNTGHLSNLESPQKFNEHLTDFLNTLP